jgi:hypothetical protein
VTESEPSPAGRSTESPAADLAVDKSGLRDLNGERVLQM